MTTPQLENDIPVVLVLAAAQNGVIGRGDALPWDLPDDLQHFKRTTLGRPIIMGRKTFESLPKALPNRTNIVITRNTDYTAADAVVCSSLEAALKIAAEDPQPFIIGGGEIYKEALPLSDQLELTRVHKEYEGDTFFPDIDPEHWELVNEENHTGESEVLPHSYLTYQRK